MICTNCYSSEVKESVNTMTLKYAGELSKDIIYLCDRCPICNEITLTQEQANYVDRIRRALQEMIRGGKLI